MEPPFYTFEDDVVGRALVCHSRFGCTDCHRSWFGHLLSLSPPETPQEITHNAKVTQSFLDSPAFLEKFSNR